MSFASGGTVIRPNGSDNFWPPVGTHVNWTLVNGIFDLATQVDSYGQHGWIVVGTIGNTDHLKLHGDHTPWSNISGVQKVRGKVYAIDFKSTDPTEHARFRDWLINTCQSNYDTTWIDFFNILGAQYDFAGNRVASSTDQHCHISVNKGFETRHVSLFNDYVHAVHPVIPPPPPLVKRDREMRVIKSADSNAVWISNGISRVHVPSVPIMNDLLDMAGQTEPQTVSVDTINFLVDLSESSPS